MYKRFFFLVFTFSTIFCFAAHPEYDRLRQDYLELQERYQAQQACYRQKLEAIDLVVHQQLKPLLKEAERKEVEADEAIERL